MNGAVIATRIDAKLKATIAILAAAKGMTLSQLQRKLLTEWVARELENLEE